MFRDFFNSGTKERLLSKEIHFFSVNFGNKLFRVKKKQEKNLEFTNIDPGIIKIIMRFFREILKVPERKFRLLMRIDERDDIGNEDNIG